MAAGVLGLGPHGGLRQGQRSQRWAEASQSADKAPQCSQGDAKPVAPKASHRRRRRLEGVQRIGVTDQVDRNRNDFSGAPVTTPLLIVFSPTLPTRPLTLDALSEHYRFRTPNELIKGDHVSLCEPHFVHRPASNIGHFGSLGFVEYFWAKLNRQSHNAAIERT